MLRALGLGDFLTGVPAYRAVRRAFPGRWVVLAAPAVLAPLVPLTEAIDELLPARELEPVPWTGPPPEAGIDLHGRGPASHELVAALRPERLVVFGGEHARGYHGPGWRADEHEVARWSRLCTESGIPANPADLLLAPPVEGPVEAGPVEAGPVVTIVHPGAAAPGRRWPAERFAAVAGGLAGRGHTVRITGSAAERDLALQVAWRAGLAAGCVLAGQTALPELITLTASARLVVCGDTGLSHLATAFARPSVTLFGPVPPAEWGPPQHPRHQVLWAGKPGYRGDPHAIRLDPALAAITPGEVRRAVDRALYA